jgi:hypothetical protein
MDCGSDRWQITAVKWNCETAKAGTELTGEIGG